MKSGRKHAAARPDTAGAPGRSEVLLRNLILSAVDGVFAADPDGRILVFNEVAAEILGCTPEEACENLNAREVFAAPDEAEIMRRMRGPGYGGRGKLKSCRADLRRRDGSLVPVDLNASLVLEEGRETATVVFFRDLREELRLKEELARAQLRLLQAEQLASLGKLAAGVAHQLNNPLNGITLYTKLTMEDYPLPDEVRRNLFRILKDAERCRDIVRELLEFGRQSRQNRQPQDINRCIERALFLVENQPLFHGIGIVRELSPALPPVPVDVRQMNHVLMNLILNAGEAMEGHGTLTVRSRLEPGGGQVRVEVEDSGPGIPGEVLPHIFEPFFTTKGEGQGTGLGLSVAYGIVNEHGGGIRVRSAAGSGATFIVSLPAAAEGDAPHA